MLAISAVLWLAGIFTLIAGLTLDLGWAMIVGVIASLFGLVGLMADMRN